MIALEALAIMGGGSVCLLNIFPKNSSENRKICHDLRRDITQTQRLFSKANAHLLDKKKNKKLPFLRQGYHDIK